MKLASIDFEYNNTSEAKLNLVCAVITLSNNESKRFWLHKDPQGVKDLKDYCIKLHKAGYYFLAFAVTAEASCFISMGLDPLDFTWIDLYLEYRCLTNHNHNLMYGKQLKKGKVVYTKPPTPKYKRNEEDEEDANNSKPEHNLAAACFKLLNIKIDTDFKNATRDLIISAPDEFSEEEKDQILEYCEEDTKHLIPLFKAVCREYSRLLEGKYNLKILGPEMIKRAEFACLTAHMEREGYPINVEKTKNFSDQVSNILLACQREINQLFPHNPPFYKFKKDQGIYTMNQKALREEIKKWLSTHPRTSWMLTKGGKSGNKDISLSLKAFTRHFNYSHNYPKDNYFAQIIRYLKLKQNLNGFLPGGSSIWDKVGSDGRVRPFFGIYGAQSSRNQPKASHFIPLKSAWMRVLIEPPKGYAICSIDYKSQEFLIAGLLSDKQMIKDYMSGDVYLAFGKSTGYIPKDGTKAEHKDKRDNCKPVILGLQFDMTKIGLAKDLSEKWGRRVSEDEAENWIRLHKEAYGGLWSWKRKVQIRYQSNSMIKLPDGWYMFGDNDNFRSVGNIPIQGLGACIMRKACLNSHQNGLTVLYPLHDAVYILCPINQIKQSLTTLALSMDEAFRSYFPKNKKIADVGLEADIWSPEIPQAKLGEYEWEYETSMGTTKSMEVKIQDYYIDPRGKEEYDYFKQYLEDPNKQDFENMEF